MKFIVCCMIVIVNISSNSKASLDSFTPASINSILFEDTTRNSDKSCSRPCKFNVKPKRCFYNFKIEPSIEVDGKPVISINGMTPGPPINVCVNDIIVVEVHNKVPGQDLALHWHGLEQKETPFMDGVPMISQCPIAYGSTYKYAFIASSPGSFFYHADSVSHQSDGVYGALIVNQPQPFEPHSTLYDYDRSMEHTVLIAAKFPELMTANLENLERPSTLLINGEEDSSKLLMMPGFAYRLRLVNAIGIECPVVVSVDSHDVIVIASDGKPVKPVSAETVKLYPGERMDVVVRASTESGGYWIRVHGNAACAGLGAKAMFLSAGFNYTTMLHEKIRSKPLPDSEMSPGNPVIGQTLESLQDIPVSARVRAVYLGIDRNKGKLEDRVNDFRYISDALPQKPYYPASLSLREDGVIQINKKNFLYPSAPILLTPFEGLRCAVGDEALTTDPQCLQVLDASVGEVLEIALVNEGFGSNDSFTFHMHGYSMHVVANGQKPDRTPISKEDILDLDKHGKINRNLKNPAVKDTVVVPSQGYVIVRLRIDHGGSWLLECRSCGLMLPTAILINVPQTIPRAVVDSLPKCGNYKPPDVLLS